MKDYLTDKTKIIELNIDKVLEYEKEKNDEYEKIAEKISSETGVKKNYIYAGEYGFRIPNWYKIGNEWYYYKDGLSKSLLFNELLGEIISEYFNLETVHYNIAKLIVGENEEEYGVISKNFCEKDNPYFHLDLKKIQMDYFNQDLEVLNKIKNLCKTKKEFLLLQDDFKKMFIRNFYSHQEDFRIYNFLLKNTPLGIRLAPLYDYEASFMCYNNFHRLRSNFAEMNIADKNTQDLLRTDERFQELLNILMQANIETLISKVEERHNIILPIQEIDFYKRKESKIKSVILENKLIK